MQILEPVGDIQTEYPSDSGLRQQPLPETQPGSVANRWASRWAVLGNIPLVLSLVVGAISHGYYLFQYPLYITDEGIYVQQAWSVINEARLSPYTYFYDHAPAGWLAIAAWVEVLPAQFQTFGNAIDTGRVLMLIAHVASTFLLYRVTCRLSGNRVAPIVAAFLFNLSPLAIFYQRQVLLDNLMVFWILLSLYFATSGLSEAGGAADGPDCVWPAHEMRIVTAMLSGLAFGAAVVTKENAIFFMPAVGYLLYSQLRGRINQRFGLGFWAFSFVGLTSLYFLYATLKNELFPSGFSFDLNNPPADHVSLLYTIWWQLHRSQGSILDTSSPVWRFSLGAWLPKDTFLLAAGGTALVLNLILGLVSRGRHRGYLVAALLAIGYTFYLARGSQMLEFYVVPLVPFLAMNLGMLVGLVVGSLPRRVPSVVQAVPVAAFLGVMVFHPGLGYVLVRDEFGKVVTHDMYKLDLTAIQADQVTFIRQHVPPAAKLIIDDDIWADLHGVRPFYKWAHSYSKAARDPDVRDKLFGKDWHNVDYIVLSNKMRDAMQLDNTDGSDDWILAGLDHAQQVWVEERGDVKLEVYKVNK
jgi:4-amino-4-deoxy-L-arabinose transferase-like glycosyltransferase